MIRWIALASVVACGSPPPARPVASNQTTSDSASTLVLRADSVGPIRIDMPVDTASLAKLLPDYTIDAEEHFYEGNPYTKLAVKRGDDVLVRVTVDRGGTAGVINVTSAGVASDLGFKVGTPYEKVVAAIGSLDCSIPPHDDPFSGNFICVPDAAPNLSLAFPYEKYPDGGGQSDGFDIESERVDALLAGIALGEVFINAPAHR